jgi:hypothetical protein
MVESQKEPDILVESLRTNRREGDDNTEETKIATVQQQRLSQREDSTVINDQGARGERRSIITSKGAGGGDDNITLNMEIKINNEYSSLVPELTKEEYESLKESIKQDGLWTPLNVNQDGVLLDGHHRYKACKELGIVEPDNIVKELNNKYDEKFFVIDSNLKRRQLNNFQKVELALKRKLILLEIAKNNMSAAARGDRNLTPLGRVDKQIGMLTGVSHDTVRKVERILLQYRQEAEGEEGEIIIQKLRAGEMSINQAYESILKEERIKKQKEQEGQYVTTTTIPSVISNNINADNSNSTNTTTFRVKEDLVNQNCQMKLEIQTLRERIKYLEEQLNHHQQQGEEEWSDIGVIDLEGKTIPIKVTVNNVKREVVLMEIDIDYYKRKARERYRKQQQQKQKQEEQKEI